MLAVEQEKHGDPPATDVAAILMVIMRRSEASRKLQAIKEWRFNLRETAVRHADLAFTHLECAYLQAAHLEGANLTSAHF